MGVLQQHIPRANYLAGALKRVRAYYAHLASRCQRGPCTLQTLILTTFCAYLLVGPVPQSADIVSASLAWGLLATITLAVGALLFHGLRIRRRLRVQVSPPSHEVIAAHSVRCILTISPVSLLPGTFLECSVVFSQTGESPNRIRLLGSWNSDRLVPFDIEFPHRGDWEISRVRCEVGDITGFSRITWEIPYQTTIVVSPPTQYNTNLPLISSTQRPGDSAPDALNRQGDPYDIKPYHPADGIKKIVWKAFAKSGELLSRHQEPSMTPEGFVAICVLARTTDDNLCGKALAYIESLEELRLDILVGCQGLSGRALAKSAETSRSLLIDCAWDSRLSTEQSLLQDVESIVDSCAHGALGSTLRKLVIFCAGERFTSTTEVNQITSIGDWLSTRGIEPVFFLTTPSTVDQPTPTTMRARVASLLVDPPPTRSQTKPAPLYGTFVTSCLSRQWEIFV